MATITGSAPTPFLWTPNNGPAIPLLWFTSLRSFPLTVQFNGLISLRSKFLVYSSGDRFLVLFGIGKGVDVAAPSSGVAIGAVCGPPPSGM